MVSFEIETPHYGMGDEWATLAITAAVTMYGYDELEIRCERGDLIPYDDLHPNVRAVIDLKLANRVLDERLQAGFDTLPMRLSYERD